MDPLPPTPLYLPYSLPYPITLQRILAPTSSQIPRLTPLLSYAYSATHDGVKERMVKVWESPVEGEIIHWNVKEGQVLRDASQAIVHIREPCTHDVQLHGLCALCGKDLTVTDYTGFSDTTRAAISMVHDVGGLTVSLEEAHRLETLTTNRLLSEKKLSLIVDLDQTIVHATVDPTVGEWLQDPSNPNYGALEGVKRFKLGADTEESEDDGCWYYVKMRPGLAQFLEDVAKLYEMHVYTMGTRAYAIEVCKVIDPEGRLFGGRILSRDESGSMTRKSLQRLFPCDTNMVVIIDDRADVWDGSPNLVKVIPYEFFVGIGDINAAFLPKKKELTATPPGGKPNPKAPSSGGASGSEEGSEKSSEGGKSEGASSVSPPTSPETTVEDLVVSPLDPSIDFPSLSNAETSTALTIHDQIESRPLKKAQAQAEAGHHPPSDATESEVAEEEDEVVEVEEAVLKDFDTELERVFKILKEVRDQFFEEVEKGSKSADVKTIIPNMKRQVFAGLELVLSGLVALGSRPHDSEYWKLAETFGAHCSADLSKQTTHVVAKENGTAKVHHARRSSSIHIVWAQWLLDCAAHWTRLPELLYHIPADPTPSSGSGSGVDGAPVSTPTASGSNDTEEQRSTTPPLDPEEEEGVAFDPGEMDWDDAAKEVDDFLNETDDDEGGGGGNETDEATGDESDTGSLRGGGGGGGSSRKRARGGESEDEAAGARANGVGNGPSNGKGKEKGKEVVDDGVAVGSPLQKRVRTSRARKSKLKVSFPASTGDDGDDDDEGGSSQDVPLAVRSSGGAVAAAAAAGAGGGTDSAPPSPFPPYEASQASSSLDSDDEAFFASMAAEVEKGWS
ncbi:hypothetical protein BCR35DRAFT_322307 [Leucosporidium creatinivorum]|uniref:RNA polymerase II subunit A C-terminal domain phosphatase n=1 Tax=Leucosporidium creatinivorum TaxID=106004 RepID=A0A1Y2E5R7_9BASI|nr:hypothetical protein BCR35DRAFT_322307 [Leucosporidium creatinivorum]